MHSVDSYLNAATRQNTRRSYRTAIEHFEVQWGGFLPATSDMVARYLADHASTLSANTLKVRLAALSQWHLDQGMPDPTKAPVVKKVLKGIRTLHPTQEKQAKPLQLDQLQHVSGWLEEQIALANGLGDAKAQLKHTRDRAILLLGFWRGFRSDELSRLDVDFMQLIPNEGLELFLPFSKGDRESQGEVFKVPPLANLCPVEAVEAWLAISGIHSGPLFRGVNRWGHLSEDGLHSGSFIALLKTFLAAAGVDDAEDYSSHSLRRGFASWATANQWDLKSLMQYVGWKDVRSAMRYLPTSAPFAQLKTQ